MTEFETIYRRYFTDVELYLRAICKDESLAEELTEQVFFQALKALPKFRGDSDIRTWLCSIARNRYRTGTRPWPFIKCFTIYRNLIKRCSLFGYSVSCPSKT